MSSLTSSFTARWGIATDINRPSFALTAVFVGAFMTSFYTRLLALAITDLRAPLGLSVDEGSWLVTVSLAPQLLVAPAVPWLTAVFGARRVLVTPALLFAALQLAIPFFHGQYHVLLVLHFISGALVGTFIPTTMSMIFRHLPPRLWVAGLSIYCARLTITLNFGVFLVGYYMDTLGWQWVYWQSVVLAPILALFAILGISPQSTNKEMIKIGDYGGMAMLCLSLAMIYAGLDEGNRDDWFQSGFVTAMLAGGVGLFVLFIIHELRTKHPYATPKVFLFWNSTLVCLLGTLYGFASLSNALLIPGFLGNVSNLKAQQYDHVMVYVAASQIVLLPIAIWMLRRVDARICLTIGLSAFALASWLGSGLSSTWGPDDFIPTAALTAIGHAFTFLGIMTFAVANGKPQFMMAIVAYIQLWRVIGPEFNAAIIQTWIRVREQTHSFLLGLNVQNGAQRTQDVVSGVSAAVQESLVNADAVTAQASSTLSQLIQREAYTLAYVDAYQFTFWCAVLGLFLVALMKAAPPNPLTPPRI